MVITSTLASALRALGTTGQLDLLVTHGEQAAKGNKVNGKLLSILDEARTGGTLKGIVRKHLKAKGFSEGAQDDFCDGLAHAYKCATVFTVYVLSGLLPEADFDAGMVTWDQPIAAIENCWDKNKVPAENRAEVRGRIVAILKAREAGTIAALKALAKEIVDSFKEEAEDKGGKGEGEAEIAETAPEADKAWQAVAGKLARACGVLIATGTEEQLNMFLPELKDLPEVLRTPLATLVVERAKALGIAEGETAKTATTFIMEVPGTNQEDVIRISPVEQTAEVAVAA